MSTDDIKYLRQWDSPFSHRKSPNTQAIDIQASKTMDANQDLLSTPYTPSFQGMSEDYLASQYNRLANRIALGELKADLPSYKDFKDNFMEFSEQVSGIESSYGTDRVSKTSTAKGIFQQIDETAQRIPQKIENTMSDIDFFQGREQSYNPLDWSTEQQETAFLANLFTGSGSDEILAKVGSGDKDAMAQAYIKFHHTKPDEATYQKMEEVGLLNRGTMENNPAKVKAYQDIKKEYGKNVVDSTIDSSVAKENVFKGIPNVGTLERKAYYDMMNWAYDDTIPKSDANNDPLVQELQSMPGIMRGIFQESGEE